ncbi:MAG: hypothetical protein NZ850_06065 [Caldimicrobium sp.]|nr:hypothetical protein [Caldimicrobium sp.]
MFFKFLVLSMLIGVFCVSSLKAQGVPIFSLKEIPNLPSDFHYFRDSASLCKYPRVVIYGADAYEKAQKVKCPGQERIVTGILYVSHFWNPSYCYLSPLPSPKFLKSYGTSFVVLTSGTFEFYLKDLEKRGFRLEYVYIKNWFEIEQALVEALSYNLPLLLLPDPPLMDQRVRPILRERLKQFTQRIINLQGVPLKIEREVLYRPNLESLYSALRTLFFQPFVKGSIHYLD